MSRFFAVKMQEIIAVGIDIPESDVFGGDIPSSIDGETYFTILYSTRF